MAPALRDLDMAGTMRHVRRIANDGAEALCDAYRDTARPVVSRRRHVIF